MNIDFSTLAADQRYFLTTQVLIPRPIAWVMTRNINGSFNLAPFSYFTAVCSDPALVLISLGKKPDGADKDTYINLRDRKYCVIHIASTDMLASLNESSRTFPGEVSEVEQLGLETVSWSEAGDARLAGCRVAMACELYEVKDIGDLPQRLILLKVNHLYVDEALVTTDAKGHMNIDARKMDPVARLGAREYASLGSITQLIRPV
ncbi:MAG: flavin reductase family protein [Hahellaceae bacterium]|nr:flavin reductase family protein [Hahellaceae bacterium]